MTDPVRLPIPATLHPDCPDWRRLGPTEADAAVRAMADGVQQGTERRTRLWSKGFSRRRVLEGGLGMGVAAMASQLVTTRVAYGATTGTLVVVFLRGGMDGLSVLVPVDDPHLLTARPGIAVRGSGLIPMGRGFALHPSLAGLKTLIGQGKVAAVPAIATPDLSRSHFQAQDCLESGGSASASARSGWLDRVLEQTGTGTTFRAFGVGTGPSRSLTSQSRPVVVPDLKSLRVDDDAATADRTRTALRKLYTGVDHPVAAQAQLALEASRTRFTDANRSATTRGYPAGQFSEDLATLASVIRSGKGVRVATLDLGGWDMHTQIGTVGEGDMTRALKAVGDGLGAFFRDLGSAGSNVTVVMMSEFGRRVTQNASGGADHGHGGVSLVLGAGVAGGVKGRWEGLTPSVLDQGDVPGSNDYRNLLGEVVGARLGVSAAGVAKVFPGWRVSPLGVMG
jgi:uncharacterized protein (DUF1501 family)